MYGCCVKRTLHFLLLASLKQVAIAVYDVTDAASE